MFSKKRKFWSIIAGRALAAVLLCTGFLSGCGPLVRTDLATYQADPGQFKGKQVVFTTTIKELLANPAPFYDRKVEVTGFPNDGPALGDPYWGFILSDKEGDSIKCYEWEYRNSSWIMPVTAIQQAALHHEPVTVLGTFEEGSRIELRFITYKGDTFDTDYLPPAPFRYYR